MIHRGRIASAAVGIAVEITLSPLREMLLRKDRRLTRRDVLDKTGELVRKRDNAPCRRGRRLVVAPWYPACDWGKEHNPIDERRVLACKSASRHCSP